MLSRTSSRNFKENARHGGSRSLASPFSSRPGSRAPSPDKTDRAIKRRPFHHTKSRTLSQSGALREKIVDPNIANQGILDVQYCSATSGTVDIAAPPKATVSVHNRSSSTPTLKPALDRMSSEPWLVASKTLLQSPRTSDSIIESDKEDMAIEHLSFFEDAPMQISTPPRRRRSATVGVWAQGLMPQLDADPPLPVRSSRYDSDVDMSDSSLPGSPSDSISISSRAKPARRRRRTIVHLSSDSLFSSSLDFSALMSETGRFRRPAASEGSRSPEEELPASELAPAFSLPSSPAQSAHSGLSGHPLPKPSLSLLDPAPSTSPSAGCLGMPPSSPRPGLSAAQASPDPGGDELLDLFSVLGLDGKHSRTA